MELSKCQQKTGLCVHKQIDQKARALLKAEIADGRLRAR